ncbi:MAG: hypothetical protein HON94_13375 [Methylococcales bacterium]|jgi:LPS-assembly lipoprotein|nr:hypothetical protein [Methylococcales bacterium]MBT7408485.1 hypothetical protein [Methylococcales bacterium]
MKNKILISLLCLFVAGCGFQLRGSHNKDAVLPNQLKKVFLDTQQLYSGLAYEIRYLFKSYGTEFVENKELASLQLRILKAHHEKRILSIGSNAKAKENEIIYEIQFDAIDENGKQVMPPQKIRLTKDYLDDDAAKLGKEEEADIIRKNLETRIAGMIHRRLRAHVVRLKDKTELTSPSVRTKLIPLQ